MMVECAFRKIPLATHLNSIVVMENVFLVCGRAMETMIVEITVTKMEIIVVS